MAGLTLTPAAHQALKTIVDAGAGGVSIAAGDARYGLGDLLALALDDLIEIDGQRAIATAKGRAFSHRVAA